MWSSMVSEKMVISSRYVQTHFPMSPSRTYSITLIAVAGALVSPCSIILHAKDPNGVLIVLYFSSSGCTLIWKNQLHRSIVERYLALAMLRRIIDWFGMGPWSLIVILLRGMRSARSLISPLGLSFGNILTGFCASLG